MRLLSTSTVHRRCVSSTIGTILAEFPHATSVRAITRLAEDGHLLEEIVAYAELKLRWREEPSCWLYRRRAGSIDSDPRLRHALSWQAAARLCTALGPEIALSRVVNDLREEWLAMPAPAFGRVEAGWWTYSAFISTEAASSEEYEVPPPCWDDEDRSTPGGPPLRVPVHAFLGGRNGFADRGAPLPEISLTDHRPLQSRPEEDADA